MQSLRKEVDLKPFAVAVQQNWWYVPLGGLLMMCIGLLWALNRTPQFKATALVAVTQARPAPRLDDVETVNNGQEPLGVIYNSLPQLAKSDRVVAKLLLETTHFSDNEIPFNALRGALEANPVMSPSLLQLSVVMADRDEATRLANLWATVLIDEANQLYDGYGPEQVVQYEQQLALLDAELMRSQVLIAEFEARNDATTLQNEVDAAVDLHAQYLADKQSLIRFEQDISAFIGQLQLLDANAPTTISDQLLFLAFQSRAYDVDNATPIQLSFSDSQQELPTVGAQIERLDALSIAVDKLIVGYDEQIAELNPVIVELQGRLQIVSNEADFLKRKVNISGEARTALARKVEEARIAVQTINRPLQLASSANVPEIPLGPRKLIIIFTSGIVGAVCALLLILSRAWLQQIGYLLVRDRQQTAPLGSTNADA